MSPSPRAAALQICPAMSTTSHRTSWADVPDAEPEPLPPPTATVSAPAPAGNVPPHLHNCSPASSAVPPPRAAPGLLSRPGATGGGSFDVGVRPRGGRSWDREPNHFAESAAAAAPAPFEDQQNTAINLDAYENIPVETSGRDVPPPVATFADIDLGIANLTEDEDAAAATNVAVHPDWYSLPEDLIVTVMHLLDIPDLFHAGAVCTSWRAAHSAVRKVRIPIKDASPCLLYSCAGDDEDTACLYSASAGTAFKVRLPAFRRCYVIGSGHGWIVAADESSNLQAFNPLTGAQVDLPPVTGLYHVEGTTDDQGRPAYNLFDKWDMDTPDTYTQRELRMYLYHRVYLSCRPSAGTECIVLLLHKPLGQMSFARVGDNRWTLITRNETVPWDCDYCTATYNKKDGMFYVVSSNCSIYAFDLNSGDTPVARKIIGLLNLSPTCYTVFAPWGDILHVWRYTELRTRDTPLHVPEEYVDEVIDPSQEGHTYKIELYKVDVHNEELVKIRCSDLRGHALFLGFNFPILVSTKDFPRLKANCVYLTDDEEEHIGTNMFGSRDVGIWNFKMKKVDSLDVHFTNNPWLNWPPPTWITPSLI